MGFKVVIVDSFSLILPRLEDLHRLHPEGYWQSPDVESCRFDDQGCLLGILQSGRFVPNLRTIVLVIVCHTSIY